MSLCGSSCFNCFLSKKSASILYYLFIHSWFLPKVRSGKRSLSCYNIKKATVIDCEIYFLYRWGSLVSVFFTATENSFHLSVKQGWSLLPPGSSYSPQLQQEKWHYPVLIYWLCSFYLSYWDEESHVLVSSTSSDCVLEEEVRRFFNGYQSEKKLLSELYVLQIRKMPLNDHNLL